MEFIEFIAVILISVFLGSVFFYGFGRRGPWGSFWSFLIIIFLGVLLFDVLTEPVGPVWYGVGWLDLIFIGLIFALLLAASSPMDSRRVHRATGTPEDEVEASAVAIGIFFWLLIFLLLISIAIGVWAL